MKKTDRAFIIKTCVLLVFLFFYSCVENKTKKSQKTEPEISTEVKKSPTRPTTNIKPQDSISSPLEVKVNSQGLWHAFEGELGIVKVFDETGKELGLGILSSTDGNWMQKGPALFSTTISFKKPATQTGKLVFIHNNPASYQEVPEAKRKKNIEIPVVFK